MIMVVEDEKNTNEAVCEYLKSIGYDVISAYDGAQAIEL